MIINDETRNIKLTLSARCYSRLETDSGFLNVKISRLIEMIICEYCEWSEKINRQAKKDRLTQMYNILTEGGEIRFFKTIAGLFIKTGEETIKNRHSFAMSRVYNWTITTRAREALIGDELSENESTNFLTDILEEYADMNYAVRERIMMRDKVRMIEKAIKGSYVISYRTRNGKIKKMAPYRIIADTDTQYNYLIGLPVKEDGSISAKPGCARIFSIDDITISRQKMKIDGMAIERYIEGRDIAYLWEDERDDIYVALTSAGESTYNLLINNRPRCIGRETKADKGITVYRLLCTEYQAAVYFSSFGKNAKILAPETLVERIKAFHSEALDNYS